MTPKLAMRSLACPRTRRMRSTLSRAGDATKSSSLMAALSFGHVHEHGPRGRRDRRPLRRTHSDLPCEAKPPRVEMGGLRTALGDLALLCLVDADEDASSLDVARRRHLRRRGRHLDPWSVVRRDPR